MTTMKNVNSDTIVNKAFSQDLPNSKIKYKCQSILNKEIIESVWDNFMGLKEQCILIKQIIEVSMAKDIQSWQILVQRLPINTRNFCCRYLVVSLANNRTSKDGKFQILNCFHYVQRNRRSYMFSIIVYKHSIDIRGDTTR